ncbi:MAG: dipeptidyl-peptidase 3 family protein [Candidatus Woesearchaeota archaeon]
MTLKPTPLHIDEDKLKTVDKDLLRHLLKATDVMGRLFLKQSYHGNEKVLEELEAEGDEETLERFWTHYGPFDRLKHDEPFIPGHEKPAGAGFYPDDLTKEEFEAWVDEHPERKEAFEKPTTVIKRDEDGLVATPYHEEYQEELEEASRHVAEAARHADDESLKDYLEKLSRALVTDAYEEADEAWLKLDGDLEVTIGPYEVYEDKLLGIKAAYEGSVCLVDHDETEKLEHLEGRRGLMEEALPLDEEYGKAGSRSPIRICNLLHSSGDARAGVHYTAFNLPNDDKIRAKHGSKNVLLKNVAHAKFDACWTAIADELLDEEDKEEASFDAYYTHILLHELSHGLGPGATKDGVPVAKALGTAHSFLEEAKADLLGVYYAKVLEDAGALETGMADSMLVTFVTGIFRSARFGIGEAHGGANIMAYNRLKEDGGAYLQDGKLVIHKEISRGSITAMARDILNIQHHGDKEEADRLVNKYKHLSKDVEDALERLEDVPIDIKPVMPL